MDGSGIGMTGICIVGATIEPGGMGIVSGGGHPMPIVIFDGGYGTPGYAVAFAAWLDEPDLTYPVVVPAVMFGAATPPCLNAEM